MTVTQIALSMVMLFTNFLTNVQEDRLTWNRHYADAKRAAQTSKRPMVVVLENPTSPQEKLDVRKLSDTDRSILRQENFELCRVDVNTNYGKRVAEAFGAKSFPYTAVTDDESRKIVFRKAGQMSKLDWTVALAKSRIGGEAEHRMVARKMEVAHPQVSAAETWLEQPTTIAPSPIFTDYGTPVHSPTLWSQPMIMPPATQCFT